MTTFYQAQDKKEIDTYQGYLQTVGALSNLYSDSAVPYLYYRVAERVFCRSFQADDLSRSDVSADAKKNDLGIGLKTFLLGNGKTFQKIAEFNAQSSDYKHLDDQSLINEVARLRNERINFTHRAFGIKESIYHCVVRDKGRFVIFEEPMDLIDINSIKNIERGSKGTTIKFSDKYHEYSFMLSKSTLTKRFLVKEVQSFPVEILEEPLDEIYEFLSKRKQIHNSRIIDTVFLPLYGKEKKVGEKSGLNQWNAGGRDRHPDEVYIPIPAKVHALAPSFFPHRDTRFDLRLPDGKIMSTKVCQDNSKALMSYSNRELGEWILRQVLNLDVGEILTYKKLLDLGIDSVRIDKTVDGYFEINFSSIGSYENWVELKTN